jgi:CheY-like chemotaxis protein
LQSQGYHTPVILITAYPNEKHRTRALDNGAVGFLSKPFHEESLIKCLIGAITTPARAVKGLITLGSTTSMQDSGLLGHILPLFKGASGIHVHVVAVGTGQALAIGARGGATARLKALRLAKEAQVQTEAPPAKQTIRRPRAERAEHLCQRPVRSNESRRRRRGAAGWTRE